MPTIQEGILSPHDGVATLRQNIVEAIDAIDPREIPFLATKGWQSGPPGAGGGGGAASAGADSLPQPCIQRTYTWQNDSLIPVSTTLRTAHASGDGLLLVAANTADYFQVDEIVVLTSGANTSRFEITAIDAVADNISVTVVDGDAAHVANTEVLSAGRPRPIGDQAPTTGRVTVLGTDDNYTQIYMDTVAVTGSEQASESVGISNRLDRETQKKLQELVIRMETNALYGARSTSATVTRSRMGGVYQYIAVDASGITLNGNAGNLSTNEDLLKDLLDDIWEQGGTPDTLMVNDFQRRNISSFLAPFVRTSRDEGVAGVVVGQYEYSYGTLNVVLNRYVRQQHLFALTMDMIGIGPLRGNGEDRSFHTSDLAHTGDYVTRMILGEYTMAVRNRTRAHGLLFNLAIS